MFNKLGFGFYLGFGILILGFTALAVGCGSSGTTATTTTTTAAVTTTTTTATSTTTTTAATPAFVLEGATSGLATASNVLQSFAFPPSFQGNTNYANDVITTPETYALAAWEFSLLSSTSTYELINVATTEIPTHFSLTGTATNLAQLFTYPDAGTYETSSLTVAYVEMGLASAEVSIEGVSKFRVYLSTVISSEGITGTVLQGDLLLYHGGAWKWFDKAADNYVLTRPASAASSSVFTDPINPDPFVTTEIPMDSFTIPSSPDVQYVGSLSFDVGNTFFFDDVDNDGVFELGTDDVDDGNGEPEWHPGKPSIAFSVSEN